MIQLAKNEIHLWMTYHEQCVNKGMSSVYRSLLSSEETMQQLRFRFGRDRERYLVTRALVRTVLSRYEPVNPKDWAFSVNPYGRPEIANFRKINSDLTFNLSHTRSLIVMGVTKGRALGVDVENVRTDQMPVGVADRFFSPFEVAALFRLPSNQQQDRFFEYWTLKESYIKARAMGLSIPLDKFSFHYPSECSIKFAVDPELADDAERWQFWQFRPTSEYLVAICAERVDEASPIVIVREAIPMGVERVLAPSFTRISE